MAYKTAKINSASHLRALPGIIDLKRHGIVLKISALTETPSWTTTFHTALLRCEIEKTHYYSKTAKMNSASHLRALPGIIDLKRHGIDLKISDLTETPSRATTFHTALLRCEIKKMAYYS
jgi:hypothetical protein